MRDYEQHLKAQYGPDLDGEADRRFYCADLWCDGHASPNQKCDQPPEIR